MILVLNKKVKTEYKISSTYQAGIVLNGAEVKSLRNKAASLKGSHIKIINGEAFLLNAQITAYKFAQNEHYDPKRTRKLLLKKKEIYKLSTASEQKGWAIVPLSIELVRNKIKVNIGLGQGLKEYEKRAKLKKRSIERDLAKRVKQNRTY